MRLVVADTGPLHYLILTGDIALLATLFDRVLIPQTVRDELAHRNAPDLVREWIAQTPAWLEVRPNPDRDSGDRMMVALDDGEQAAIALAIAVEADLVLMDDRDGVAVARQKGLAVTGTLGVLDLATRRGIINLAEAFTRLKATSFYYRQGLLDALLARQSDTEGEQ
jgi:predicted nucleic acid-binding protein